MSPGNEKVNRGQHANSRLLNGSDFKVFELCGLPKDDPLHPLVILLPHASLTQSGRNK
jgi:hypothetical protein